MNLLDGRFRWTSRAWTWEVELSTLLWLSVWAGREHGCARACQHGEQVPLRVQRASWPTRLHAALEPTIVPLIRHVRNQQVETTLRRRVRDPVTKDISVQISKNTSTYPNRSSHYFAGSTDSWAILQRTKAWLCKHECVRIPFKS